MDFIELAGYFQELEKTRSRNAITEIIAESLKLTPVEEIGLVAYLLMGELGPLFNRVDFSLAEKMVMRAIARAYEVDLNLVWGEFKVLGDLGTVATKFKSQISNVKLNVNEVYLRLGEIAKASGEGSQENKVVKLADLLKSVTACEAKYIIRIVLGRMRLGFSDKTILDALSVMEHGNKDGREALDKAYQVMPDIGELARLVKADGITGIENRVRVTLGVPVMSALCQRLKTADEMIEKMGEVIVEPKFDGTRVQIHIRKNSKFEIRNSKEIWKVKTFTRNLEETSQMFPELEKALDQVDADELILDSEAVGIHPQTGKMLPFQMTITRKRKHGVDSAVINVPLKFFVFDVLYKDGKSLIDLPLRQRREILENTLKPGKILALDEKLITDKASELRDYHTQKLKEGLEGVVIKQIESAYEPGRRGWSWVKFKEAETAEGKLSDTLDAVVMGFYRGQGKRSTFGIGAFLVGLNDGEGKRVTIAKIGTGLSDDQWKELRKRLELSVSIEKPESYVVAKGLIPDVWSDPMVIVEIAADEITKSPIHSAGYALRFPRLVKFRDDKNVEEITTVKELLEIRGRV